MTRKTDEDYFDPAPGIVPQTLQYPFDNEYEIFTLRKDMQPTAPPGQLKVWGNKKSNYNPGGTMAFYTTDTKFMSKLFQPMIVAETGCAAIIEMNYTLDQSWPLAFGFTPIARKRQFSLIMQNHDIGIIADLYVPEKFADLNMLGIPDGYSAFATRGHSKDILALDIRYNRALQCAKKGLYVLNEDARMQLKTNTDFSSSLFSKLAPLNDIPYSTKEAFQETVYKILCTSTDSLAGTYILSACEQGQLNCFLVYGGGESVRRWVMQQNKCLDSPHVWWYPDAMDTIRLNRKKDSICPTNDINHL